MSSGETSSKVSVSILLTDRGPCRMQILSPIVYTVNFPFFVIRYPPAFLWEAWKLLGSESVRMPFWIQIWQCPNLKVSDFASVRIRFWSKSASIGVGCRKVFLKLKVSEQLKYENLRNVDSNSESSKIAFWSFQILMYLIYDASIVWHFQSLTLSDPASFWLWHFNFIWEVNTPLIDGRKEWFWHTWHMYVRTLPAYTGRDVPATSWYINIGTEENLPQQV